MRMLSAWYLEQMERSGPIGRRVLGGVCGEKLGSQDGVKSSWGDHGGGAPHEYPVSARADEVRGKWSAG